MKRIIASIMTLVLLSLLFTGVSAARYIEYNGQEWYLEDKFENDPRYVKKLEEFLERVENDDFSDEDEFVEAFDELWDAGGLRELEEVYASIMEIYTEAVCEFDEKTGTVTKILNDEKALYIPPEINGVPVTKLGRYILEGKNKAEYLAVPPSVSSIDETVALNCPVLKYVDCFTEEISAPIYENCPSVMKEYNFYHCNNIPHTYGTGVASWIDIAKSFAVSSGVIIGENGNYNWEGQLTRVQATIMILRLMGEEENVSEYAGKPCAFSDVPDWAKGYVNLAVEKGITKGVGSGLFGADNYCNPKDFITMLFRLTHLKENEDYSWATAYSDIYRVAEENDRMYEENVPDTAPYPYVYSMDTFQRYLFTGGDFTREIAAHFIYIMMNSVADDDGKSLGDILSEEYGMSDIVLYNNYIRRTDMGKGGVYKNEPGLFHAFGDDEKHIEYIRSRDTGKVEISEEVRALAKEITKGKTTDYKKAEAICEWVSEHIFYDMDHFSGKAKSPQDALTVLKTRKGVCAGYAALTKELMLSCEIECHTESSASHAWNVAYIGGRVVFIDNTWECDGLRYKDGKYRENEYTENAAEDYLNPKTSWEKYWFDRDSEEFITSHGRVREPLFIRSKSPTER